MPALIALIINCMKKNSVRFKRLRHAIGLSLILVATLLILCSSNSAFAQTNFATLNTDGGWCWFSDPRALFHNGKLYYGYVKSNGKTALDVFGAHLAAESIPDLPATRAKK